MKTVLTALALSVAVTYARRTTHVLIRDLSRASHSSQNDELTSAVNCPFGPLAYPMRGAQRFSRGDHDGISADNRSNVHRAPDQE
jgi:hypothetical protein